MIIVLRTQKMLDLVRVGVYAQMEGTFTLSGNRNNYRFRFYTNQIADMKELLERACERVFPNRVVVSISSRKLFNSLFALGFKRFRQDNWNLPNLSSMGVEGKKEYIRAVIDSLGNVDISENSPYIQVSSINGQGLGAVQKVYAGNITGPYTDRKDMYLKWSGKEALDLLDYCDWKFNNYRNQRGSELIRTVRWEDYLI